MELHFDSQQAYQWQAVQAITGIFEGQSLHADDLTFSSTYGNLSFTETGFANNLEVSPEQIWENVRAIQDVNNITRDTEALQGMHFSVEMETGTGKTYVYIRTIYELHKLYGFKKFVIVVPSIAIREGVLKNLQVTHHHFQSLYDRTPVDYDVYDSKNITQLRNFASANSIQILIINIDSFAKDDNIINQSIDAALGRKPVEFIQNSRPIVIVDEPQRMETALRQKAIANLNPLCTLRYSATHRHPYNLVYSLNPVKAYDLGLVKQIEVDSVFSDNAMNDAFMKLESITATKTKITARIVIHINTSAGPVPKSIAVKTGDDLFALSKEREVYRNGFIITGIDAGNSTLSFSNGSQLSVGQAKGGMSEEIMKFMIRKTIEEHLRKELKYFDKGIKVLSLIFIDRVSNYRQYHEEGKRVEGKYAIWFEEIFASEIKKPLYNTLYKHLGDNRILPGIIHDGYFSKDKKGRITDTSGDTQADNALYKLIMQDKELLLDQQTPLRFIFSHSALTEGWDNPNVFQICTLNETKSEVKKRQEIGRGLRLAVDQTGNRVTDPSINRLTVIANESYEDFAKSLQQQIEEECNVSFAGRIKNKNNKQQVKLRKGFELDKDFQEIWNRIKYHTSYSVSLSTPNLIFYAGKRVKEMPETKKPAVQSTRMKISFSGEGIEGQLLGNSAEAYQAPVTNIPDILSYIQDKTELTRKTILDILKESGRLNDIFINPQLFMDNVVSAIRESQRLLMTDGIQYTKRTDSAYDVCLFDDTELEIYPDSFTYNIGNPEKTIYTNYISLDSGVENQFAKDCESSEDIEFYFKLPLWFKIQTPIGSYNPDWAIVFKGVEKVYFVAETKSLDQSLREEEKMKIKCGRQHFKALGDVHYEKVSAVSELVRSTI